MAIKSGFSSEDLARMGPDALTRKRMLAEALLADGMRQRKIEHPLQGAAQIAEALIGGLKMRKLDQAESYGRQSAQASMNELGAALAGPSAFPGAPGGQQTAYAGPNAAPIKPDDPNVPSRFDFARAESRGGGSLPPSFTAAVDKHEGGGDYDTLFGHAQRGGPFAGVRVSEMPISQVLSFADPSGQYAQSVKGKIGRVATPMGRHQIVGTTLRNAVAELGIDPNTPFNKQTQDQIAAHLARKRIQSSDTMEGKIAGLRSEWEGFKNVPYSEMAQIVTELESGGSAEPAAPQTQVASLDPSAGMREMPQGYAAMGLSPGAWAAMNAPEGGSVAPNKGQEAIAQALMGANNPGNIGMPNGQGGMQAAGGDFPPAPADPAATLGARPLPQGGPDLQMLMQAAGNQWMDPGQKGIIEALIGQKMKQSDPANMLDSEYKRAQIDQLRAKDDQWQKLDDDTLFNKAGELKELGPVTGAPKFDDVSGLRKEIQQLPSYKNYSQAVPIYKSMVETADRDTRASDLNLVYGLGKIMDPTSVVREGEMVMVKNTSSLPDWLQGAINSLNGGSALTPETREAILTEAYGRMKGYDDQFKADTSQYGGIVERNRMNAADVIPQFGEIQPWKRKKQPTVIDGYTIEEVE